MHGVSSIYFLMSRSSLILVNIFLNYELFTLFGSSYRYFAIYYDWIWLCLSILICFFIISIILSGFYLKVESLVTPLPLVLWLYLLDAFVNKFNVLPSNNKVLFVSVFFSYTFITKLSQLAFFIMLHFTATTNNTKQIFLIKIDFACSF